jgi:hypothetical protein
MLCCTDITSSLKYKGQHAHVRNTWNNIKYRVKETSVYASTFSTVMICKKKTKWCFSLSVHSIKCWDCNSRNNPPCGDTFDNYTVGLVDCDQRQDTVVHLEFLLGHEPPKASLCRKTVQIGKRRRRHRVALLLMLLNHANQLPSFFSSGRD